MSKKELQAIDTLKVFAIAQKLPLVLMGEFGTKQAIYPASDDFELAIIKPADVLQTVTIPENKNKNFGVMAGKKFGTIAVECTPEAIENRDMGTTARFQHPYQDKKFFIYNYNTDLKITGTIEVEDGIIIRHIKAIPIFDSQHRYLYEGKNSDKDVAVNSVEIADMPSWLQDAISSGQAEQIHSIYEFKPNHRQLAMEYISRFPNTVYGINSFWRYDGKTYVEQENWMLRREIISVLTDFESVGIKTTNSIITSVFEIIKTLVEIKDESFDADEDLIALDNGIFNLNTLELMPFSPDYMITIRMSYPYDKNATCPNAMKCVNVSQPNNAIFLQQYAGYSITPSTKYETAVWMAGFRGGGKSTIIKIFETLLGKSCGTLGLADIEKSKFALASVPGKKLLVSSEQPSMYISCLHILNSLISGDTIHTEQKFQEGVDITPHAKLMFAMNKLPQINSAVDGLFRKVKILKFYKLDPSIVDLDLKDKIATEGSGIFNWAVEGLKSLRQNNGFTYSEEILADTERYHEDSDIVGAFISEMCVTGPKVWVRVSDLYSAYNGWCERTGHKPMNDTNLRIDLDSRSIKGKKHGAFRCFMEIRLKTDSEISTERNAFEAELKESGFDEPPTDTYVSQQITF